MMEEVQTLEINGKEYILLDSITTNKTTYHYFSNESDSKDIYVLKDEGENFVSTETPKEFNDALVLFYEKHKNDMEETTTM